MRVDNNIINKKRFQVPSDYFESIDSNTFKNFNLKPKGFLVPDLYFQSIDKQQIFNRIYISKIRFLKNNFIRYGSMAAIFIGFFFFINNPEKTNNNINSSDVINYINDDLITLENFEFLEILDSNDLSYENLVSNNDIENYFIESSLILENLIFE
ncbi:MAG: hypothetical protein P8L90_01745 [Flavobacteriaceae bacterium]|nr:hypothetical protein [Flavobacteriaceae bacterium]